MKEEGRSPFLFYSSIVHDLNYYFKTVTCRFIGDKFGRSGDKFGRSGDKFGRSGDKFGRNRALTGDIWSELLSLD